MSGVSDISSRKADKRQTHTMSVLLPNGSGMRARSTRWTEALPGRLARESWNVSKTERERDPTKGWAIKKEVLVPTSRAPGDIMCLLCAVAAVPALHSDSLCWAPSVPVGKGESTMCLLQKAWTPGPQRPAAVCIWDKLSPKEPHKHPMTPEPKLFAFVTSTLSCDFYSVWFI